MNSNRIGMPYLRPKPVLRVLRGYDPLEPTTRMERFAPADTFSDPASPASQIWSGMVISKSWSSAKGEYEWVKGLVAGATPFIATEDALVQSVVASGTLPALSCDGQFTLATGYFDPTAGAEDDVSDDVLLSAFADDGAHPGYLKVAATGEKIVGVVNGGHHASLKDEAAVNSQTSAANAKVIQFVTRYTGATA